MDEVDYLGSTQVAKFSVECDRRQQGVSIILELSIEKAIDRGSTEMPDKVSYCFA